MQGTNRVDTPYEVGSNIEPPPQPLFTEETANSAQQVVSLGGPGLVSKARGMWARLSSNTQRRLLPLVVVFALAGGVAGGLLASAQREEKEPQIDLSQFSAGVAATTDQHVPTAGTESSRPENKPIEEFELIDSEVDLDEDEALKRVAKELRKRDSRSRRKAYMIGVITGDGDSDRDDKRRGRKHGYWDDDKDP